MKNIFLDGLKIAKTYDVSTPKDSLVLYSISFLPTKENRDKAFSYVGEHQGMMMMEHTSCGAKLVEIGLASSNTGIADEDVAQIWKEASKRLIEAANGNITAFVENADPRSVFVSMELPTILHNSNIPTINNIDKFSFAQGFEK